MQHVEMALDAVFGLLERWLIDDIVNRLNEVNLDSGRGVIPDGKKGGGETGVWFNYLAGQAQYSDIFVLNLENGNLASWQSHNDQSWVLRRDDIRQSNRGKVFEFDPGNRSIKWNNVSISEKAKKKIREITAKHKSKLQSA